MPCHPKSTPPCPPLPPPHLCGAARKLVELLRQLASAGRAIITTIHQPSSQIYRQLDTVLLLSQGHPIFYGKGGRLCRGGVVVALGSYKALCIRSCTRMPLNLVVRRLPACPPASLYTAPHRRQRGGGLV